jgi:glutamate synthase (NADPH/NADH) small chain
VLAHRIHLGVPDSTGRQTPEIVEDSQFALPADLVVMALGFDPENVPSLWNTPELAVSRWGTVQIDRRSFMTNLDGVFAAGDIVRGASLVVWAVRDGRDAAEAIAAHVTARASVTAA